MPGEQRSKPKYQELLDTLAEAISTGKYPPGQRLPSEAMLVKQHGVSRITVGRAMRELQQRGLIDRVAGSGSFVRVNRAAGGRQLSFGLLIPELGETEIFEPICQGIAGAPDAGSTALIWGHVNPAITSKARQAEQLCDQYISRQVSGVFFAPLEFEAEAERLNRKILTRLGAARIPVVLLDRRPTDIPLRNRPDLVGINHRQAAFVAADHLIGLGCRRIGFMAHHGSPFAINARLAGYRDALASHGLPLDTEMTEAAVPLEYEAYVCVNDRVAGQLMHVLLSHGVRVPQDVRIVGIDDVNYSSLLPVPLTTVHQPCREIGAVALSTMLERIDRPHMPPRDILLDGELVVRASCGAALPREQPD